MCGQRPLYTTLGQIQCPENSSLLSEGVRICRAAMDAPPQKRTKFSFVAGRNLLESKGRLPELHQLSRCVMELAAPQAVREKFCGLPRIVGIDVETHALAPTSGLPVWRTDEFCILTKASGEALPFP